MTQTSTRYRLGKAASATSWRGAAPRTDALLLASATPHNGDAESFAELISMLDPAAIADKYRYEPKDIKHLYIRRTKISPEVTNEIGGKWRDRGPSQAVSCPATPEEERVFGELTATWLGNHAPGVTSERRLFPYTLLKAFLSSHKALAKTAENRLKNATDEPERQALATLKQLAEQITDQDSAKVAALVAELREIGVGPGSSVRAVVFSESVPTLKWLHEVLPKRLGLTKPGQVDIMHGGFSDIEQERIVERFCLEDEPVRVLLTESARLWRATRVLAGVGGLNGWTGWRRAADRPGRRLRTSRELFHAATKHTVLISGPAGWASPA